MRLYKPRSKSNGFPIWEHVPKKLQPHHVQEIRRLASEGKSQHTIRKILLQRGVSITQAAISYIINRKRWAHIP